MNDKIIINTISKIHFIIISAMSFIFLSLCILFILLQNGVHLEKITLPNLQVEKLYIKWNEKLDITIQDVKIIENSKKEKTEINKKQINKIFNTLLLLENWFEKIELKKIVFNDIHGSFRYIDGKDGFLTASSDEFSLKSFLFFESDLFNARIDEFLIYKQNIKIDGNIIFDAKDKIELISSLNINIENNAKLKVYIEANKEKLFYKLAAKENIHNIKHIIEMIDMPKEVKYWAHDAIKTSDVKLIYANGWLDYNKLEEGYKNLHVLAMANKLKYTYNPRLKPVITKKTELEFKDGVLFIRPKRAYQYGFYLNKSWLKIDFTKKEELLTLFLLFNGKVNKDLLYLLNTYKIKLPFLQNSGSVKTDLKIEVGLRNIDVTAKGKFFTKEANFNYLGLDIDIFNALILLDNYDVTINNMYSKYKDIATADVNVRYDAKKNAGSIDFKVQDINFKDIGLTLKKSKTPLKISYKISNKQDTIESESSTWEYKNKNINVDKITIPFNIKTLVAKIPTTLIGIENLTSAYASGIFSLNPIKTDLDIDLLKLTTNGIEMNQPNASLKIKYDKKIIITSNEKIKLNFNSLNYIINNTTLEIEGDQLNLADCDIKIKELADVKLNAKYDLKNNDGIVNIKKLHFKNKDFGKIYSSKDNIKIKIKSDKGTTKVEARELGINYTKNEKSWNLNLNSLKKISENSKLLQDYNITNGSFTINKYSIDKNIKFRAKTKYPYKFLVIKNTPIQDYTIRGEIDHKSKVVSLNINNSVDVTIDKEIILTASDIGINIDDVLNYFNDRNSTSKQGKNAILNLRDSFIYISKDRHIISDSIDLQYLNKVVSAQLKHKEGSAGFKLRDTKFYLYGDKFGDKFMEKLFALSKFKDGELSFSMTGSTNDYDGLMYIKNTTILDYKILNNILAFVNTIPSLVTFSIPGYSKKGLEVQNAYMSFHSKNDMFDIKDISFNSKEIDIVGRGSASFKYNTIDIKLNLKTDLGSKMSKLPLVGYIIFDEDTISTTMKISGKLNDPDVKSLIAKDIVVMPLNIIKRTLLAPFQLFKNIKKDDDDKKTTKE